MPSAEVAALKAARSGALRLPSKVTIVDVTSSSNATGRPQTISAAKLNVTEARGASLLDLPGVTIGQMSPSTTIAATTQNSGWRIRPAMPVSLVIASPKTTAPATVTDKR